MKPYSQDLRDRVLRALRAGKLSQAKLAAQFGLSLSTVEKWWAGWRTTGRRTALPGGHGVARTLQPYAAFLRTAVKQQPDATLEELCEQLAEAEGVWVSASMMCRELQGLRLPRKKKPAG